MRSLVPFLLVALAFGGPAVAEASASTRPYDVAVANGNVYVVELGANRVAQRALSGQLVRYFGADRLSRPMAVAADASRGRLYVVDSGHHRVVAFALDGRYLYSFGGFSLTRKPGKFSTPLAIAVGPQRGYVYVSDRGGMIQVLTAKGGFLRWWGHRRGDKSRGQWVDYITGLSVYKGRLYATDSVADKVRVFTVLGAPVASYGPKLGGWNLDRPSGVDVAADGSIYVSDAYEYLAGHSRNEKVLRLSPGGKLLNAWGNYCATCARGTNNRDPLSFWSPQGVEVAGKRLYVADAGNNRVQVLTLDGRFIAAW